MRSEERVKEGLGGEKAGGKKVKDAMRVCKDLTSVIFGVI